MQLCQTLGTFAAVIRARHRSIPRFFGKAKDVPLDNLQASIVNFAQSQDAVILLEELLCGHGNKCVVQPVFEENKGSTYQASSGIIGQHPACSAALPSCFALSLGDSGLLQC